MRWLSQVCHKIYKPENKMTNFKTHAIMWKTTNLWWKYEHTLWPKLYSTKIQTGLELWLNWVWYKWKMEWGHIYLQVFSGEWLCKVQTGEWEIFYEFYLYLTKPMGNALCYPLLCNKQIISPNISTSTYHWSEYSTTHHPGITIFLILFLNTLYLLRVAYAIYPQFPP